jgi:uncharacterized protein YeaO (DUF488 family)
MRAHATLMQTAPKIKRVYATPEASDGTRILVDRLWPRGLSKEKARVDLWLKDLAPSDALRKRFHGRPEDWEEFCATYAVELEGAAAQAAVAALRGHIDHGPTTLVYAAHNESHNNAVALSAWLA